MQVLSHLFHLSETRLPSTTLEQLIKHLVNLLDRLASFLVHCQQIEGVPLQCETLLDYESVDLFTRK